MNDNLVRGGLVAAATLVVTVFAINAVPGGLQLGGEPSVSSSIKPSEAEPSIGARRGLPEGPFVATPDDLLQITLDITSPGWRVVYEFDGPPWSFGASKDFDYRNPPDSVSASLFWWTGPAANGVSVRGDACRWSTTTPEMPATTAEEIAAALAAQTPTEATTPADVALDGYTGKALTTRVPMGLEFADCDQGGYSFYELHNWFDSRVARGPGQIDEVWILDVGDALVILDAEYSPATPASLVDELRALAESATFE
jgi:hypothetical protein